MSETQTCGVNYFCVGAVLIFVGSILLCALGFSYVLPYASTHNWPEALCTVLNSSFSPSECSCSEEPSMSGDCVHQYPCLQVYVKYRHSTGHKNTIIHDASPRPFRPPATTGYKEDTVRDVSSNTFPSSINHMENTLYDTSSNTFTPSTAGYKGNTLQDESSNMFTSSSGNKLNTLQNANSGAYGQVETHKNNTLHDVSPYTVDDHGNILQNVITDEEDISKNVSLINGTTEVAIALTTNAMTTINNIDPVNLHSIFQGEQWNASTSHNVGNNYETTLTNDTGQTVNDTEHTDKLRNINVMDLQKLYTTFSKEKHDGYHTSNSSILVLNHSMNDSESITNMSLNFNQTLLNNVRETDIENISKINIKSPDWPQTTVDLHRTVTQAHITSIETNGLLYRLWADSFYKTVSTLK